VMSSPHHSKPIFVCILECANLAVHSFQGIHTLDWYLPLQEKENWYYDHTFCYLFKATTLLFA